MSYEIKVFKIIDKNTNKFSTGGYHPNWTNRGKTWSQINHVKNHLRAFIEDEEYKQHWKNNIPENWEVLEFSNLTGEKRYSARELYPVKNIYENDYKFKHVLLLDIGSRKFYDLQQCIKHLKHLADQKRLFGEFVEGPAIISLPNIVTLKNVSHMISNIELESNQIYGDIEILQRTNSGEIIKKILDTGIDFGKHFRLVPRMNGIVRENFIEVTDIITWDILFVENPNLF